MSNIVDDCVNLYNKYCHPILFSEIKRPPIWPVIVTAIIIFIAVGEIGSQDCTNGHCNHYKNVDPELEKGELLSQKVDYVIEKLRLNHTVVGWRRALLLSMILSLVILIGYYACLPDGFDYFLVTFILFVVIYGSSVCLQWYWWRSRDNIEEEHLYKLRNQIKQYEIQYGNPSKSSDHSYNNDTTDLFSDSYDYVNSILSFDTK